MKARLVLVYFLVIAVLLTSFAPLCVFAEGSVETFGIGGYISINSAAPGEFNTLMPGFKLPAEFVRGLKKGVKVEVKGTSLSAVTDASGYFLISNIPASDTGYVLKFSGSLLLEKEVSIDKFAHNIVFPEGAMVMDIDWDQNKDGTINMSDYMLLASRFNAVVTNHKISGYVKAYQLVPDYLDANTTIGIPYYKLPDEYANALREGVRVEVKDTGLSAVTDKNGYFEIENVPESADGYVLKFKREGLIEKEVVIDKFTQDVIYPESSPIFLTVDWDQNGDGIVNMADILLIASKFNTVLVTNHKISGYIAIKDAFVGYPSAYDEEIPSDMFPLGFLDEFKKGIKVEVKGTDLSAVTGEGGYFEIINVPAKETGYTLVFSGEYIFKKEVVINTFTQDALYDINSPIILEMDWDFNNDNAINMSDIMAIAARFNVDKYPKYIISGYITPNFEFAGPSSAALKDFKVEVVGKGTFFSDSTNQNGNFKITFVNPNEAGYTLRISRKNYLSCEVKMNSLLSSIDISSKDKPLIMYAGDMDDDNVVSMSDIMLIAPAFNSQKGDVKYIENLDINLDGAINISDIIIVAQSFNKKGPIYKETN